MFLPDSPSSRNQIAQRIQIVASREVDLQEDQDRLQRLLRCLLREKTRMTRRASGQSDHPFSSNQILSGITQPAPHTSHHRSASLIEHLSLSQRWTQHGADKVPSPRDLMWRGHYDVLAHDKVAERPSYLNGGSALISGVGQDDKQIDVTVRADIATGLRPEEDNAHNIEFPNDAIHN